MSTELRSVQATIPAGGSLSIPFNLGGSILVGIVMPAVWDAASLTFQMSDGDESGNFNDVYQNDGTELEVTADVDRVLTKIPELNFAGHIKVRSGTSGTPVNQTVAKVIKFIIRDAK